MVYEIEHPEGAAKCSLLFEGWQETLIWSCLQGIMGHLYADAVEEPSCAMALLGDFCFLSGKPHREIVQYKPACCKQDFIIMVPRDRAWAELIEECYKEKAKAVTRFAIKKEPDVFDRNMLQKAVASLPEGYTMKSMDEDLFYRCKQIPWCRDWVSQYADYGRYERHGLGTVIMKDGEPVSGASSYASYRNGIEIEIDTREDHRRKGLAFACGAGLILECLKRGWYPSWDAQNKWSLALARKLGYHPDYEYAAYEIWGYGPA